MVSISVDKGRSWFAIILLLVLNENNNVGAQVHSVTNLRVINIGVFFDPTTQIGKEQKVGLEIASEDFNKTSKKFALKLHFVNSSRSNPLQAAFSAIKMIKEKKIDVIITTTENSEEASLFEEMGNEYEVPVLALSATFLISSSSNYNILPVHKAPSFFVQMSDDYYVQINFITSLIKNFGWKKVIAVYEDSGFGSSTSMLDILSQALQDNSEIEYRLALPPLEFMSNPKESINEELAKVYSMQSRIFIILQSSLPLAIELFKEANEMGLVGRDTAWIITDSISNLLDVLNSSTNSYMEGTLGIKTYYNEFSHDYATFSHKFKKKFPIYYPNEESFPFGIHALRAYDTVTVIGKAIDKFQNNASIITPKNLLQGILSSNFTGLSGEILIENGKLDKEGMLYNIVNVVGKSYKELDIWSPKILRENNTEILNNTLYGNVNWPGYVRDIPKGWGMPTNEKPLKVGIPSMPPFDNFIMAENEDNQRTIYTGFCIDIFLEAIKIVEESYGLPFDFEVFNGTYDELVESVHNKTYDIAVGDITIQSNRSELVDFTQPYTKPGLSLIVPLKPKNKALMFIRPFTLQLWVVTLCMLLYTTLIVWWIESRIVKNYEFQGGLAEQLNVALWFTFCSLFHVQQENINSNLTRTTLTVWFFVVFALTSSYTASLTSMLTVPLLEPIKVKDMDWLSKTRSKVGCDGGSVWNYLVNVHHFSPENVINVTSRYDYQDLFANGTIVAAFLEPQYQKFLVNQHCKTYTHTKDTFGFGGQGFVFQKGSPIRSDVSKAMLELSENGVIKKLENKWFPISSECLTSLNDHSVERLNPMEFLVIFLIYVFISVLCLLSYIVKLIRRYRATTNASMNTNLQMNWVIKRVQCFYDKCHRNSKISPITSNDDTTHEDDWITLELSNYPASSQKNGA